MEAYTLGDADPRTSLYHGWSFDAQHFDTSCQQDDDTVEDSDDFIDVDVYADDSGTDEEEFEQMWCRIDLTRVCKMLREDPTKFEQVAKQENVNHRLTEGESRPRPT